ncbi:VCBS repeat-containing protein [Cytophagaceae bacterium DM2B3-1]|uniref:VCBS repeat-containing protein n=1 Tax=Xanthocytophaga flava TaxID=3048013 RepID=A0ABT7CHS4_9BACT|nr:VCBS repeat-containing protein [Xanthocytophaga flavus]MDJ1493238.1 VCBS repeat-containing protein [Xanthocytophaga flavus]
MRSFSILCLYLFLVSNTIFFYSCTAPETYPGEAADRRLAEKYCQSCHQLPTPDLVDKRTWKEAVFPKMGPLLGITGFEGTLYKQEKGFLNSYLFPDKPILSDEEWRSVMRYFTTLAPEKMSPQIPHVPIQKKLPLFQAHTPEFPFENPVLSLVKIDTLHNKLYFGDGEKGMLFHTDKSMKTVTFQRLGTGPVQMDSRREGARILLMGSFHPSDFRNGELTYLQSDSSVADAIITGLSRPTHVTYQDLNADGKEDIVISGFGYYTGSLNWYEKVSHQYMEHILNPSAGAIQSAINDFNKDGKPDILVLMAQGNEGFDLYTNKGNGVFSSPERILQFHPSFGSNSFSLVDFNNDGKLDIIATNGDNGDYRQILKPYHGVRIYLNDGENHFTEKYFYPINGITKAVPVDFDQDGDLDIATIAYFPDYEKHPEESFVYLENKGSFQFEPFTFPEFDFGRWQVMDTGDIDKDGDIDILLGSCVLSIYPVPEKYTQKWDTLKYPVVWLENKKISGR